MKLDTAVKQDLVSYLKNRLSGKTKPRVKVIAPYKLTSEELNVLKKKIEFLSEADIEQEIDTTMLAGVIIQYGSQMLDLSLKNELQKLEQTLYETA